MYWKSLLQMPIIVNAVTSDRYFKLRNNLKLLKDVEVSDERKEEDRLWKVRPLLVFVRKRCMKVPREAAVSVDEQMIPFTGQSNLKQYVPNKPNPTGLKNFVLATPSGIVLDLVIYQGKNTFSSAPGDDNFGVGGSAVTHLSTTLLPGTHIVWSLLHNAQSDWVYAKEENRVTGTIIKSRLSGAANTIADDKSLSKKPRGSSDMCVQSGSPVAVVKWFDNKAVLMASSAYGISLKFPSRDGHRKKVNMSTLHAQQSSMSKKKRTRKA